MVQVSSENAKDDNSSLVAGFFDVYSFDSFITMQFHVEVAILNIAGQLFGSS